MQLGSLLSNSSVGHALGGSAGLRRARILRREALGRPRKARGGRSCAARKPIVLAIKFPKAWHLQGGQGAKGLIGFLCLKGL